jgi:putative membrane protein
MVSSLLSDADAREVEAAVTRVERGTAAELVVAVLPRSADHWQGRLIVSLAWAFAGAFAVLEFAPLRSPFWALLVQLGVGALSFWVLGWAPLQRWFVSPAAAQRAAHARAFQLFAERGLYGTEGRTALLIFVSELERRVVLLGDAAIHAQLGQAGWDTEVSRLITRIRERRLRDGLLEVIADLEPRLAAAAPRKPNDVNELPDAVLRA